MKPIHWWIKDFGIDGFLVCRDNQAVKWFDYRDDAEKFVWRRESRIILTPIGPRVWAGGKK